MSSVSEILNSLLIFALLLGLVVYLRTLPGGTRKRMMRRMRELTEEHQLLTAAQPEAQSAFVAGGTLRHRITYRVTALGDMIPLLDGKQRSDLGMQLIRAGYRDRKAVSTLIGIKLIAGACGAVLSALFAASLPLVAEHFFMRVVVMSAAFMLGMIWPETMLRWLISRRQHSISTYFPDALDLMVICTNAGNSLSVCILRVARELQAICPALSDEFQFTADQLQVDGDTATALRNMSARIGVQSMRSLVTTLIQSQQYGTPISQALKTLARSERNVQMMSLEEKASKLAAKMTIPMMLFILPTVGIIAAGPAVLKLIELFNSH